MNIASHWSIGEIVPPALLSMDFRSGIELVVGIVIIPALIGYHNLHPVLRDNCYFPANTEVLTRIAPNIILSSSDGNRWNKLPVPVACWL